MGWCPIGALAGLAWEFAAGRCTTRPRRLPRFVPALLGRLVALAAPSLVAVKGVGTDVAGALLAAAGDNPERLVSEASFAALCGASPIQASSGRSQRHRLNRGGDRQANRALYSVVLSRLTWDDRTRAYIARRTGEGKSKREAIRCLKRDIARELYREIRKISADLQPRSLSTEISQNAA